MSATRRYKAACKHLTEAQLLAFFRAAAKDGRPRAVHMVTEHLDNGQTLAEWCAEMDRPIDPPFDEFRFHLELKVVPLTPHRYHITFGISGKGVGDGGEWTANYAEDGSLLECKGDSMWMA